MNKRIKELVDQAKTSVPAGSNPTEWLEQFHVKFTELVVQECIDIVKPTEHHRAWAQSYLGDVDGLELLDSKVDMLRKHFSEQRAGEEK